MTVTTITTDLIYAPTQVAEMGWAELRERRKDRFRMRPSLKVRTEDAALAFLNDVGCAFLFSGTGLPLPNLWDAINGGARAIPGHHHDHALGLTWNWKDSLPAHKAIWYGKLIKQKPTFVSLDLLPAFYALSTNFGELDDYLEQYAD